MSSHEYSIMKDIIKDLGNKINSLELQYKIQT